MRIAPFALTIFLSAFLLFQVQPLIARFILPWFGGSAGVWSVTMLFFQAVLLLGYAYAHLLNSTLRPVAQALVHTGLLAACALLLPIVPPESLKPSPDAEPIVGILVLLAATVGAPYFALATTGPLLQAWFARALPGKSPYPLYALSNVGSLLALLSYPFAVEPAWGRVTQAVNWSWGFGAFAVLCAAAAWLMARSRAAPEQAKVEPAHKPSRRDIGLWIALPAAASALLLAATNEICIDVASVPFLWVLPLSIYLLSFIVTFIGRGGPRRGTWYPLAGFALAGGAIIAANHTSLVIKAVIGGWCLVVLVLCITLHGETYRIRPPASGLTKFYLCVSLGGVLGGLFVAVLAPLVFPMHLELHITLAAIAILLLVCLWTDVTGPFYRGKLTPMWGVFALLVSILVISLGWDVAVRFQDKVLVTRSFHGTYAVYEPPPEPGAPWYRELRSGTTIHGVQNMEPARRGEATSYYGPLSGVSVAFDAKAASPVHAGVIGLGTGSLAALGRKGDRIRFYEINPVCERIAREYFFYLGDSSAQCDVVIGDARLSLEREEPQKFDLLVLDAFTSDSIPVHLLTLEAFELYLRHLKPDGVVCAHISNRHLDLAPVVRAAALKLGLHAFGLSSGAPGDSLLQGANWVILSRSPDFEPQFDAALERAREASPGLDASHMDIMGRRDITAWTDDYSNLFSVLN